MPAAKEFLRIKEASEYLGVSANTMRTWCRDGKIPEHRHPFNNYRLFKRSDLDQIIRKIERSATRAVRKAK